MKKKINPIHYKEINIRLIIQDDIEKTLLWRNNHQNRQWFNNTEVIDPNEHKRWFESYLANNFDYTFIVTNNERDLIGQFSIYNIDIENESACFGRFLANPSFQGKGLMKLSCECALLIAKNMLGIKKLTLDVKSDNTRAIHIYHANKFKTTKRTDSQIFMEIDLSDERLYKKLK